MFSTKLCRVANRANPATLLANPIPTAAQRTSPCVTARRSHQRRPSSSKASCPPDSSPKPAPTAKAATTAGDDAKPRLAEAVVPRASKRYSKTKRPRTTSAAKSEDRFADLPTVPSIHHLPPSDISVSSFFSLHRPLSLTTTIPPPTSAEAFDSIFETQMTHDAWHNGNSAEKRPEDVIYALQNTVDVLENESNGQQDEGMRWEVLHEHSTNQEGIKHLDGVPRPRSFDELVAQFKPFRAPPPPQPFPEEQKASEKKTSGNSKQRLSKAQPRQKSYSTTIIVTESTTEDGQTTFTAQSTPLLRVSEKETQTALEERPSQTVPTRYRFAERMKQRQQASLAQHKADVLDPQAPSSFVRRSPLPRTKKMFLISVKRQRKLKMKKHKYKKLMKRTRNLRRRQDRA